MTQHKTKHVTIIASATYGHTHGMTDSIQILQDDRTGLCKLDTGSFLPSDVGLSMSNIFCDRATYARTI